MHHVRPNHAHRMLAFDTSTSRLDKPTHFLSQEPPLVAHNNIAVDNS
jgi:hypothetical protein